MKNSPRLRWIVLLLLAAAATKADSLSYTNTIAVPPGNPPARVGFDIPLFDPAMGTLQDVRLNISGNFTSLFSWTELSGGSLTAWQTNALSIFYGNSVLATKTAIFLSLGYPNPINGNGQQLWGASLTPQALTFKLASDLANFMGTGTVPLSAEYYNRAVVNLFGPPGTWSLNNQGSVTVAVAYDYLVVPEPGSVWLIMAAGLLAALRRHGTLTKWQEPSHPRSDLPGIGLP